MTITEKKYIIREMRKFCAYKPKFSESQLQQLLYVALGYFDMHGNPKSRRIRMTDARMESAKRRMAGQP